MVVLRTLDMRQWHRTKTMIPCYIRISSASTGLMFVVNVCLYVYMIIKMEYLNLKYNLIFSVRLPSDLPKFYNT